MGQTIKATLVLTLVCIYKNINKNKVKLNAVHMMRVNLNLINSESSDKGIGLKPKTKWLLKANINSTTVYIRLV